MSFSSRFMKDELISAGQTLTWKGHDTQTVANVMIKELHLQNRDQWKGIELFEREVQVLRQLDYEFIPKLVGADLGQEDPHVWMLAQEWIPGADLRSASPMNESAIRELTKRLLQILVYLQGFSPPLIHRDIKPANIILNDNMPFLVDFGAVQLVTPSDEGGSTIIGTSGYMAPEQLMGRTSPSSDLYGLGMTLVWLLTRCDPNELPMTRMKVMWEPALSIAVSQGFTEFINRLIAPVEEDRFTDAKAALSALTGERNTALQVASPSETNLKLTRDGQVFEILRRPDPSKKPSLIKYLMSLLFFGLMVTQLNLSLVAKVAIDVVMACVTVGLFFLNQSNSNLDYWKFRIDGKTWSLETRQVVVAQGLVSKIRGLSHIHFESSGRTLALVSEDRTQALFDVSKPEEEWLKYELSDFLESRHEPI